MAAPESQKKNTAETETAGRNLNPQIFNTKITSAGTIQQQQAPNTAKCVSQWLTHLRLLSREQE